MSELEPERDRGRAGGGVGPLRALHRRLARLLLPDDERDRWREGIRREIGTETSASEERILARLLPEIEGMRRDLRRTQDETAAILRVIAGPCPIDQREARSPGDLPSIEDGAGVNRRGLFDEMERGSRAEVAEKIARHLDRFRDKAPVVDLGCGRGEFLELARQRGLPAYGVDSDPDAVAYCRELGLDVREEDIVAHLGALPDASLGGVFCAHVVEHLPAAGLPDLLVEVARVLGPGGVAVVETPNPATFATHVQSFWRDPTHIRPVPEPALCFAVRTAGLVVDEVVYTSPTPEEDRLKGVSADPADPDLKAVIDAFNSMTEQLNQLLYGHQDYAVVAVKPE